MPTPAPRFNRARGVVSVRAALLVFALGSTLLAAGEAQAQCGGHLQRACCIGEGSGPCNSGLTEVSGCSGSCQCGGGSIFSASSHCIQVTGCGGSGQRACCLGEGNACGSGLTQVPGCSGNCYCTGGIASSSGSCVSTTACGSAGQRACCLGETINGGNGGGCRAGTFEAAGCTGVGSCICGGGTGGSQSSSRCIATTACGGVGQRACCIGEAATRCTSGLTEVPSCPSTGDACRCAGSSGASSSSQCVATTACGGSNQRACCVGETINGGNGGGCNAGLAQVSGCTGVGSCVCGGGTGGTQSSSRCVAVSSCGGAGQRACCIGEGPARCGAGLTEVPGCTSGNCLCAGNTGASSSSRCVATTACGGAGQRACCVGETVNGGNGGGCNAGLAQVSGCTGVGDCTCGGGTGGSQSSSRCVATTTCGGDGQRACCVGERAGGACNGGLTEVPGCTSGNCLCAGGTGASSSGMCLATTACGAAGQRACCVGETINGGNGGGCAAGLAQVSGCTGVGNCTCGGGVGGTQSSSRCLTVTACGAESQRACCIGEATPLCRAGLTEVPGCTGNCYCPGSTGASASGTCTATTACGGAGQRACCAGEGTSGTCRAGLTEVNGCAGNCFCAGGVLGTSSSGTCLMTTQCGGEGQRACCIGESANGGNGGGCDTGLLEVSGCADDCECAGGVLGAQSSSSCQRPGPATACGALGQRACCSGIGEGQNCASGLIEVAGCAGNCLCGGTNPLNLGSSGTCHRPTPCGGEGQRGCCVAERITACNSGLTPTPGCAGDCFCGASATGVVDDDALGTSSSTCMRSPAVSIAEPAVGMVSASGLVCSQAGYADLHMHLFADIAHGGGVLAGNPCPRNATTYCSEAFNGPLAPGGCSTTYCNPALDVNSALGACYGTNTALVTKAGQPLATANCPPWLPNCGAKLFHGDHTLFDDAVGAVGTGDGSGDSAMGAPTFSGWPQWSSTTHQQAYYTWLERAWRGGLRLVVQMAVTNTALCLTNKHLSGVDCNDSMAFIDQQLQAAYDFENFIDVKVGNGTDTNSGWFRIVKTPAEARQVLADGKLAVVLGVEVDNLFNCKFPSEQCVFANDTIVSCTISAETTKCKDPSSPTKSSAQFVREQVDRYYDVWGVRHMFPIHNFDNSFGGAATWQDVIEVGNRWVEGHWYNTRDCSAEGFSYKLGSEGTSIQAITSAFGFGALTTVPYHPEAASCNAFGLFPLGRELIGQMMRRGMMVDIDHMSARSLDDTMTMAEQFRTGGYPLAASHALFTELHVPSIRHERMRTPGQLARLKSLGSMVGVMLKDDTLDRGSRGERSTIDYPGTQVVDDCRHSSRTFAQALAFANDRVGASGMGSDFDGVAGHFAPRFGSDACGGNAGERSTQLRKNERLGYPFTLSPFGTFNQQQSGTRTFDYNESGLAHLGLLPDFVADLQVVGLEQKHVDPLLRSADAYIRLWERAEGKPIAPTCGCGSADAGATCVVILPDGGVLLPDGGVVQPDGGVLLPDGGVLLPDGGVLLPDGGVLQPDGGVLHPDGGLVQSDGGVTLPDGGVLLSDGGVGPGDDTPTGCGCTTVDGSSLALALLALVRLRSRRGRSKSSAARTTN